MPQSFISTARQLLGFLGVGEGAMSQIGTLCRQ